MNQRNFPLRLDDDIFKGLEKEKKEIGISINKIINLKLKGLRITNA